MKQIASFSLGDLTMNSFNTQNQCDDFSNEPTQEQIIELMREAAEIQDAQQTFFGDLFEEDHTDEAHDAWKDAKVFGGIFLD